MKKQFILSPSLICLLAFSLLLGCGKKKEDPKPGTGTTPPPTTTVSTAPALDNAASANTSSDITAETAKVSSTISANGGATITQYGHVWSDSKTEPTTADAKTELGKTDGPFPLKFSSELKNLKANMTYNVRAYATNDKGTSYGTATQVKTAAAPASAIPVLVIKAAENITPYGFKALGGFTALGGNPSPVSKYGFVWSTSNNTPIQDGADVKKWGQVISGLTVDTFVYDYSVSGLQPTQTCYIRAFGEYTVNGKTNTVLLRCTYR